MKLIGAFHVIGKGTKLIGAHVRTVRAGESEREMSDWEQIGFESARILQMSP